MVKYRDRGSEDARYRGYGWSVLQRGVPYTSGRSCRAVDVAGASKVCCCCLCLFFCGVEVRNEMEVPRTTLGATDASFENLQPNARVSLSTQVSGLHAAREVSGQLRPAAHVR